MTPSKRLPGPNMPKLLRHRLVLFCVLAAPCLLLAGPGNSAQQPKQAPKAQMKPTVKPMAEKSPSYREELVRLIPEDVALCLVVTDLRTQGDRLMKSPWMQALKDSPFGHALGDAPELLKLAEVKKQIQKYLKIDWDMLRNEILGDSVVLAYRPPLPGAPESEGSLLLLHARNPSLLKTLMERLNEEQQRTGELKDLKVHQHQGTEYLERVEAAGSQFYYVNGPLLAFSGQEAMLKNMLERRADQSAVALPIMRQFRDVGVDKALASVWINPRGLDGVLQAQAGELGKDTPEGKSLRTFLNYWNALEGVSLSVQVDKQNPELVLALHARSELLPEAARKLVADTAKPSEAWALLPADSIVAVAARGDFEVLMETLEQLLPGVGEEGLMDMLQSALGLPLSKELLKELALHVGPDWGFSVAAPAAKDDFPHVLLAFRLRSEPDGADLVESIRLLTKVAIKDYNSKNKDQIDFTTENQNGIEVNNLRNGVKFPKGFRPAFAKKDGYLVVASSPEALHRFGKPSAPRPQGMHTPIMKIGFKQLAALIKDRRESVTAVLGKKRQMTPQAAAKHFEHLTWSLEQFDTAEMVQRTEGNRLAWIFRMRTAEPAKK
jgi:hypothetical protein